VISSSRATTAFWVSSLTDRQSAVVDGGGVEERMIMIKAGMAELELEGHLEKRRRRTATSQSVQDGRTSSANEDGDD
jgi:hypothetical protein